MSQKTLGIKLEVDTSGLVKITSGLEKVDSTIKGVVGSSERLSALQTKINALQQAQSIEYINLYSKVAKANDLMESGARGHNLAEKNIASAIEATNKRLVERILLISSLERQLNAPSLRESTSPRPTATSNPNITTNAATGKQTFTPVDTFDPSAYAASLRSQVELENTIRTAGHNKQLIARAKLAADTLQIEQKLAKDLHEIQQKVSGQTISKRLGESEQKSAIDAYGKALRNLPSLNQHIKEHKNLFLHVFEIIGAYRIWNTVINTVLNSLRAIPRIGIELESTVASLTATLGGLDKEGKFVGSGAGMASVMQALTIEADRTGIAITTLRESFRGFQASTSLAGESLESTWTMFTNLDTVITGLHLPADKANGIFLAMAQIFNKTKVQSEELVKQLGNLLPGAFASFAAANRDLFPTSEKLIADMKKGVVFAHDTVEKFTDFLAKRFEPSFALASQGLNANIGRLETSFTLLGESIYSLTSGPMVSFVKGAKEVADYLRDGVTGANNLGDIFKGVLAIGLAAATIPLTKFVLQLFKLPMAVAGVAQLSKATLALRASIALLAAPVTLTGILAIMTNPVVAVAGLTALAAGYLFFSNSVQKGYEKAEEFRKVISTPLPDIASTRAEKIKLSVENSPELKEYELNINRVKAQLTQLSEIKAETIAKGPKLPQFIYTDLDKQIAKAQASLNDLEEKKQLVAEGITIKIDTDADKALKDLSDLRDKIEVKFLDSLGDSRAKKLKQYEITEEPVIQQLQQQIDITTKQKAELEAIVNKPTPIGDVYATGLDAEARTRAQGELDTLASNIKAITMIRQTQANIMDDSMERTKRTIETIKSEAKTAELQVQRLRDDFQSKAKLAEATKQPIDEAIVQKTLLKFDEQKNAINKKAAQDIVDLQNRQLQHTEESLKNQVGTVTKAWAVIQQMESSGNKRAVSSTGALGLMQVQPSTLKDPGLKGVTGVPVAAYILELEHKAKDLHIKLNAVEKKAMADYAEANAEVFADFGKRYYAALVEYFKGDLVRAAAAYNAGFGKEERNIRPPETVDYVKGFTNKMGGETDEKRLTSVASLHQATMELIATETEGDRIRRENQLATALADQQRKDSLQALQTELLNITGDTGEAARQQLLLANDKKRLDLQKQGNFAGLETLKILEKEQLIEIKIKALQTEYNQNQEAFNLKEQEIANRVAIGQLTKFQGMLELNRVQAEFLAQQDVIVANWVAQADISKTVLDNIAAAKAKQETAQVGTRHAGQNAEAVKPDFLKQFESDKVNDLASYEEEKTSAAQQAFDARIAMKLSEEEIESQHLERKDKAESDYRNKSAITYGQYYEGLANIGSKSFASITSAMIKMYGAKSAQAKASFAAYKAFAVAEAIIGVAKGVAQNIGIPIYGWAAAALIAAAGAIEIATIIAQPMPQAHAGLTSVPEDNQTYLLKKNERVLAPQQNEDLTNFLKNANINNQQQYPPQNIRIINAVDPELFSEWATSSSGEKVIMNVVRRNKDAA